MSHWYCIFQDWRASLWLNIPSRCLNVPNVKVKVDHRSINEGLGFKKGVAAHVTIQPWNLNFPKRSSPLAYMDWLSCQKHRSPNYHFVIQRTEFWKMEYDWTNKFIEVKHFIWKPKQKKSTTHQILFCFCFSSFWQKS